MLSTMLGLKMFFSALLRYKWYITLCKYKVHDVMILYIYCKMFIKIRLVSSFFISYCDYFIVGVIVSALKICSEKLSNIQYTAVNYGHHALYLTFQNLFIL